MIQKDITAVYEFVKSTLYCLFTILAKISVWSYYLRGSLIETKDFRGIKLSYTKRLKIKRLNRKLHL